MKRAKQNPARRGKARPSPEAQAKWNQTLVQSRITRAEHVEIIARARAYRGVSGWIRQAIREKLARETTASADEIAIREAGSMAQA